MALVLLATLVSASGADARADGPPPEEAVRERLARVDRFAWDGPSFIQDSSLERVRGLGKRLREEIRKVPNRHVAGQVDEYRTLVFDGLELYGRVTSAQEFWPVTVAVTSAKWKIRDDLNVGTSAARIQAVLGPPMEVKGNVLLYEGETERVKFYVDRGAIRRIEFLYYAD